MTTTKTPVSEGALMKRINRHFAKSGELKQIRKSSEGLQREKFGKYHVVENNTIKHDTDDIESYARELGVLGVMETLVK